MFRERLFDQFATRQEVFDAFSMWLKESRILVNGSVSQVLDVVRDGNDDFYKQPYVEWNALPCACTHLHVSERIQDR